MSYSVVFIIKTWCRRFCAFPSKLPSLWLSNEHPTEIFSKEASKRKYLHTKSGCCKLHYMSNLQVPHTYILRLRLYINVLICTQTRTNVSLRFPGELILLYNMRGGFFSCTFNFPSL